MKATPSTFSSSALLEASHHLVARPVGEVVGHRRSQIERRLAIPVVHGLGVAITVAGLSTSGKRGDPDALTPVRRRVGRQRRLTRRQAEDHRPDREREVRFFMVVLILAIGFPVT
jgi:hypothetical protein